jgi:glycoside/pentoside/hexuronide:cation symporter, GPH family
MTVVTEKKKKDGTHRLTLQNKLAFGFGDTGAAISAGVNGFYLNAFLLDVAGLRPGVVAVIFFIAQIWDALNDPLIGSLSDRTRSRFGRRRSWLLFGAVPFGAAFFLHWLVPPLEASGLFWYYLVIALLLRTAFTAVNVPYTAMTPEMTDDYDERTELNSYRFSFSIIGGMIAIVAHPYIVGAFGSTFTGHAVSAGVWGFFIALSALVCFAGTFEAPNKNEVSSDFSYTEMLTLVFKNRPFLLVTGIYLLSWLTLQFVQQFLLLFVRYTMDSEDKFPIYILILQLTAFIFLAIWAQISRRIGKKQTYVIGATIWIVAMICVYFVQAGQDVLLYPLIFAAGIGVSTAYLTPWSMLPDVIDYDELQTGQRREGIYYGLFAFLQQAGISLGVALGNFGLQAAGYINPVEGVIVTQPASVLLVLRLIVSFIPALMLAISIPIALAYPITRERHAEIQAEIAASKNEA